MKYKWILALVMISSSLAAADAQLGNRLTLSPITPEGGGIGLTYAYTSDWGLFVTYRTNVSQATLSALPETVYWNLYDSQSATYLQPWTATSKGALLIGNLAQKNVTILAKAFPDLTRLEVVFAVDPKKAGDFYLPLNDICTQYPHSVRDLDTLNAQPCVVTSMDQGRIKDCADWDVRIKRDLDKSVLKCEDAKSLYSSVGCGDYYCGS